MEIDHLNHLFEVVIGFSFFYVVNPFHVDLLKIGFISNHFDEPLNNKVQEIYRKIDEKRTSSQTQETILNVRKEIIDIDNGTKGASLTLYLSMLSEVKAEYNKAKKSANKESKKKVDLINLKYKNTFAFTGLSAFLFLLIAAFSSELKNLNIHIGIFIYLALNLIGAKHIFLSWFSRKSAKATINEQYSYKPLTWFIGSFICSIVIGIISNYFDVAHKLEGQFTNEYFDTIMCIVTAIVLLWPWVAYMIEVNRKQVLAKKEFTDVQRGYIALFSINLNKILNKKESES